jgi:hypothetical protein
MSRDRRLLPDDPFFKIDLRAVNRLRSLEIQVSPNSIEDITLQLSHPAPLLESLTMEFNLNQPPLCPEIPTALFDGDLSSLRELELRCVRTRLPWRNMVNLTSFALEFVPPGFISVTELLDFFECAPHLREIGLSSVPLVYGERNERVVSLTSLENFTVHGSEQTSPLIGHLSIPVGASLETRIEQHSRIEDHLPRSLDNLKNFLNFSQVLLHVEVWSWEIRLTGPNGHAHITSNNSLAFMSVLVPEFLTWFKTSTIDRLEVTNTTHLARNIIFQLLLPMRALRTLTIAGRETLASFISALDPDMNPQNTPVCPRLKELVIRTNGERGLNVDSVMRMRVARARRGAKLESVRIVGGG